MVFALDVGRQEPACKLQRFFDIFKGFYLHAGQRVDHRQVVARVGKFDLGIRIKGVKSFFKLSFSLRNDFIATLNGGKCY